MLISCHGIEDWLDLVCWDVGEREHFLYEEMSALVIDVCWFEADFLCFLPNSLGLVEGAAVSGDFKEFVSGSDPHSSLLLTTSRTLGGDGNWFSSARRTAL